MDEMRKEIARPRFNEFLKPFADSFLAKLLNGDGDLDIDSRDRKTPQMRVKIVDGNRGYLTDYASILKNYGFRPRLRDNNIFVRCSVNLELAHKLFQIGAFQNNPNLKKLKFFIDSREPLSKSRLLAKK